MELPLHTSNPICSSPSGLYTYHSNLLHNSIFQGQPGDLLLLAAGKASGVNKALDRVRQYLARSLDLIKVRAQQSTALDYETGPALLLLLLMLILLHVCASTWPAAWT